MEVGSGARMTPWLWSEEGDALDDERRERGRGRFQGEATEFGFRRCEFELLSSLWLERVGRREKPVQFKGRVRAVGGA